MTALSLLAWIAAALALQLAVYLAVVFWRHWHSYRNVSERAANPAADGLPTLDESAGRSEMGRGPAWQGFRNFRVVRKVFEDAGRTVCSFYLAPEDGAPLPPFLPGQFLTFRLDVPTPDGATAQIVRCYSLSDAPRPDGYRISVKRVTAPLGQDVPPGRSSNFLHDRIDVGDRLQVRAPSGHFHLRPSTAPVVLVGGGIGITPMLSMLNSCLAEQPQRQVWLFYGVRRGGEIVMREHLEALAARHPNFQLRLCFSAPRPEDLAGPHCHQGRIDVDMLRMQLALEPYEFYICGPGPLLESLVPALEAWGVPESRIHYEAFGPSSLKRKPATATATTSAALTIDFARSGKRVVWSPEANSLLELAEASGIDVPSGCRAGGCGSCQTKIQSGEVAYRQAPDYDPAPGHCLLCVGTPKTNLTLEA